VVDEATVDEVNAEMIGNGVRNWAGRYEPAGSRGGHRYRLVDNALTPAQEHALWNQAQPLLTQGRLPVYSQWFYSEDGGPSGSSQ